MKLRIIASAIIILGVIAAFQFESLAGIVLNNSSLSFWARCSGDQEVPIVDSDTKAYVRLVKRNDAELWYSVSITKIKNLQGVHIHTGVRGSNGPVAADLSSFSLPPVLPDSFFDITYSGKITNADLQGDLRGSSLEDLMREMVAGNAYVNIHTTQNPSGEVRGQIMSSISIDG